MAFVIKTNGGVGAPGYTDDNAPGGMQWLDLKGEHLKVPEGTKVQKTGKVNKALPTPYIEINILDGKYAGTKGIWVKYTHVMEEVVQNDPNELVVFKFAGLAIEMDPLSIYFKFKKVS